MKNLFLLATGTALLLAFSFCKNTPLPEGQTIVSDSTPLNTEPEQPLPMGKLDSLAGFKGCEKATWSPLTANSEEFIYQHYIVKITRDPKTPGEQITVLRDANRPNFVIPMPDAGVFKGVCKNKLFVDTGTGPDGRELFVYDVDNMTQIYNTRYYGDPEVVNAEKIYFLMPAEESDVTRKPDCPEKEEWLKDGLRVGYGQRCIFNFTVRSLTRKSEWACVPLQ
ncbi:MAG: hypothetical protein KIS77_10280 [Saprospiraceae bacterium]|nr:hypothetical protein [Saprospiraceae bacterium]